MNEKDLSLTRSLTDSSSIGQKLRAAREAKKIDETEISNRLCLAPDIIKALEEDNYAGIPLVFVQGYIKNYANLLGLTLSVPAAEVQKEYQPSRVHTEKTSFLFALLSLLIHVIGKVFNYIVIIGLIALIFIWWHQSRHTEEKNFSVIDMSIKTVPFPKEIPTAKPLDFKQDSLLPVIRPWWPFE